MYGYDRDWAATIGAFGLLLLTGLLTLIAVMAVLASIASMFMGEPIGYALLAVAALGFACIFWSCTAWCWERMVEG